MGYCVYYKFKTGFDCETIQLDRPEIRLGELEERIFEKHHLLKERTRLQLSDKKTNRPLSDKKQVIRSNSTVLVARLPAIRAEKKAAWDPTRTAEQLVEALGEAAATASRARLSPPGLQQKPSESHSVSAQTSARSKSKRYRSLPAYFTCPLCKKALKDAMVVPCCGDSYCKECIQSSVDKSPDNTCPGCDTEIISKLVPNKALLAYMKVMWTPENEADVEDEEDKVDINVQEYSSKYKVRIPDHMVGMPPQVIKTYLAEEKKRKD